MEYILKVLMLGDFAVGKTSLVHRYVENRFSTSYLRTIGTDIYSKVLYSDDGEDKYIFQIWDLSGDQEFRLFRREWYRAALGGIIVSDLSRPETIDSLHQWVEESRANAIPNFQMVFAGNKLDLLSDDLSHPHVKRFERVSKQWEGDQFIVSAKTGIGVADLFQALFKRIMNS